MKIPSDYDLKEGMQAPDFSLINTSGNPVQLSEFWSEKPLVLMFLRYYGCAFCKEQAIALRTEYLRFKDAGCRIVCVGAGAYQTARAFQILYGLPFEIVTCGEKLDIFNTYGLGKARLGQILNQNVLFGLIRNMLHGIFNNPFSAQALRFQMPGSFVIDRSGKIVLADFAKDLSQLTDMERLLSAVQQCDSSETTSKNEIKRAV
jgi:peroxiredoxin